MNPSLPNDVREPAGPERQGQAPQLWVVTGHSRGLGEALARLWLARGDHVLGISRGHWADAGPGEAQWADSPGGLSQWQQDLASPLEAAERLREALAAQHRRPWRQVTLVNNAAIMNRLGPLEAESLDRLSAGMRAGVEAPALLSAAWLSGTGGWGMPRRILNISSGLGRRAMAGSAAYCAVKAGMDHLTRAMALDEAHKASLGQPAATVVSLAPGVIDTDMQGQIRGSQASGFPDLQRFVDLQAQQQLATAQQTAERIDRFLSHPGFGHEAIVDIRTVQA